MSRSYLTHLPARQKKGERHTPLALSAASTRLALVSVGGFDHGVARLVAAFFKYGRVPTAEDRRFRCRCFLWVFVSRSYPGRSVQSSLRDSMLNSDRFKTHARCLIRDQIRNYLAWVSRRVVQDGVDARDERLG